MNTRGIAVPVSANLAQLQQGFGTALAAADRFQRSLSSKLKPAEIGKSMAVPASGGGASSATGATTSDQAAPADAAMIAASFQSAVAPLASFASRIGMQFEKVGGTIITLARRIDENMKFPKFQAWISGARGKVQEFAANSEGRIQRFAQVVDKSLGAISGVSKLRHLFVNLGDVAGKTLGKLAGIKPPDVNFNSSTRSITNLYGATTAATGGLKAFAGQAALALGVFGLGFKAVQFFKDGIAGAMNLGETMSKTKEVFGTATDGIVAQAEEMAAKFGINKQVSLDAASSFGLIAKAGGLSGEATAKLSNDFTKLAGDVSSFYNIPIDQALEKMRSGLVGEAEPMRALGVLLSEDAVKAEAWRTGIAKAGQELTDQQKVQARAALIQKGLATASGDLERTQGSASNQARQFAGSMENLATSVGALLLPALTKGLGLLNEFGSFLGRVFEENKATLQSWGDTLTGIFEWVGILFRNWEDTAAIVGLGIVQGISNILNEFQAFGTNVVSVVSWIAENWLNIFTDVYHLLESFNQNLFENIRKAGAALIAFLMDPTQGFKVDWTPMLDGFKSALTEMPEMVGAEVTDLSAEIQTHADNISKNEAKRQSMKPAMAAAGPRGTLAPSMGEPQSIRELKDITSFANKIKEDLQTPLEKYKEGMANLVKARDQGLLTDEQFQRGKEQVARDSGINAEPKFAAAAEMGSKEAYSSVVGALNGRSNGMQSIERSGERTAANSDKMVTYLQVVAASVNTFGLNETFDFL